MILLTKRSAGWYAEFTGEDSLPVFNAGLTNPIQTGFTERADPWEVHAAIQKLNPDSVVRLEVDKLSPSSTIKVGRW